MADRPPLIEQVASITGCNHYQAETVLGRSNWDFERAVNSYFDDPPPEVSPPFTQMPSSSDSNESAQLTLFSDLHSAKRTTETSTELEFARRFYCGRTLSGVRSYCRLGCP